MKKKLATLVVAVLTLCLAATCFVGCGGKLPTIQLSKTSVTVYEGETVTVVATVTNADNLKTEWSTSDATVATVADGVITGVKAGTATVTAKVGEASATCQVTVSGDYVRPEDKGYNTYNTYVSVSPSNWNQLSYQDNNDTVIMTYIGDSFFDYDFAFDDRGYIKDGEYSMKYAAATALEDVSGDYAGSNEMISEDVKDGDGYAWKITLRDDLKWDDGTSINAESFVYSMKEQLNPLFQNYRADTYYNNAMIIHNAYKYLNQGKTGDFPAANLFTSASGALEAKAPVYLTKDSIGSAFQAWFGGTYDQVKNAGYFGAYFTMDGTEQTFFEKYNVETAEGGRIAVTAEMLTDYGKCLDWNPDPESEILAMSVLLNYTLPEMAFSEVGFMKGDKANELIFIIDSPINFLKEDGSLSYLAAYNLAAFPLVKQDLYESCKQAPSTGSTLWTTNYCTSVDTTASWGPYKLTSFQSGKEYILEKNEHWYGYSLEENENLYQTDRIVGETIASWSTAWQKFQAGEIDTIGMDVSISADYKGSSRAVFTPDDFVQSLQIQSSAEALKNNEKAGEDKEMLNYADFRKAMSLAIDRAKYTATCTTSSLAGFGLFNSMHYIDVDNGVTYRSLDEAKHALCSTYGVNPEDYDSLDDAVDAITGYNLDESKKLVTSAYNAALEAGTISATDKVVLVYGSALDNEVVRRTYDFFKKAFEDMCVGTPLEGRVEIKFDSSYGEKWADDFRAGAYEICAGGWTGAAWDPGYMIGAYLMDAKRYAKGWDPRSVDLTLSGLKLNGEVINKGEPVTQNLMAWYDCLNGNQGCAYNFGSGFAEQSERAKILAALEEQVLLTYYAIPVANSFSAELVSYKIEYVTTEYNTFMAYGGMKYISYNYSDSDWTDYVNSQGGSLNYK